MTFSKAIESISLMAVVFLFIHFSLGQSNDTWHLLVSLEIIASISVLIWFFKKSNQREQQGILTLVSAMFFGFWLFNSLRYFGLVRWPLARASSFSDYALLLCHHIILSLVVLVPALIAARTFGFLKDFQWGRWTTPDGCRISKPAFLYFSSIAIWCWVVYVVYQKEFPSGGPILGFIGIAVIKAVLTGFTEEVCFRGVLQPTLCNHFGISWGLVLQSSCYMLFHIHLGEVFFSKLLFLTGVWLLGLILGVVTRLTSGIGWAVVIHTALDVIVECGNLS